MKTVANYWNLIRLNSSGELQTNEIVRLKQFIIEQFSEAIDSENLPDTVVQKYLVTVKNSQDRNSPLAQGCLRCFVSYQIKQACIQLDIQFGREHGFSRHDLFIYTLDDTLGNLQNLIAAQPVAKSQYKSLAVAIIETFDPEKASLSTWTSRYVKQHKELKTFLLEQGVYLVSNWAILNDTKTKQVNKILGSFHSLTQSEIEQFSLLLSGYHNVYRRDRLKNRQSQGKKCQTPTREQLERISNLIEQQTNLAFNPEKIFAQLEKLANFLREYRIYVRGGKMKQESLDNTQINSEKLQASATQAMEDNVDCSDFLQSFRQQFQKCLDTSIETVITNRLSKFKGKKAAKAPQFLTALELFHCQGESMSAIAPQVELEAQYQVTRLLKLKELRVDIRHHMLQTMQEWTVAQAQAKLASLTSLKQREQEIASALEQQIDLVVDEAEREVSIADSTQSILAKRICDYLDRCSHNA